jgi:hypothetical protein
MVCPRCESVIVTKDGTTQFGGQRFRCSRVRPDRARLRVPYTRHGCSAQVLRAGNRLQWHDAASGHHRHCDHVSASTGRGGARRSASDRAVSYERHRARPWVLQRAAAADARPQVCCFSGDLRAWSRPDAQHSTWFLPDCAVSPKAAGIRLGMDSTRGRTLTFRR